MATIKSFTSLEQSKKLAEILPSESADMEWINGDGLGEPFPFVGRTNDEEGIPCWSLSALLELIPPYLGEFKDGIDFGFSKAMNSKWYSAHYIKLDNTGLATFTKTVTGDTAVDAAFEMVCWLKENDKL